jgi:hypothetical protein
VERNVAPQATDPAISAALEPHLAINPSPELPPANKLFVFMASTGTRPSEYRALLLAGAQAGYHVIGLSYVNLDSVQALCETSADPECHLKLRREIVTGENASTLVDVNAANAVLNRLGKLVSYLARAHPQEGWSQFIDLDGSVQWSRVGVSGHSQGGGHAVFLGKLYSVDRVSFYAAPVDWRMPSGTPAAWLSQPGATPAERHYGLAHLRDPIAPLSRIDAIWRALGLNDFGQNATVDGGSQPPYGGSHRLVTDLPARPGNPVGSDPTAWHRSTTQDAYVPLDNGVPVYGPVWRFVSFPRTP